jgi:solute carrier family 35 protein C2
MTDGRHGTATTLFSIIGWYISSSVLICCNKIMLSVLNVRLPLTITFIHFSLMSFILAAAKAKWPSLIGPIKLPVGEFRKLILPIAVCTAGDVGFSNMSYSRVPISVMVVLKSSAPVCIYFLGVFMGLETFRWRTTGICLLIAFAIGFSVPDRSLDGIDSVSSSPDFMVGCFLVLGAVIFLGIRWVLIQSLAAKYSPTQLLFLIQPPSALVLLPISILTEFDSSIIRNHFEVHRPWKLIALLIGSVLSAMKCLLCEYQIVHQTSSLTLSVAGIGKEVLTLILSFIVFREEFTSRQIISIFISLIGILIYSIIRKNSEKNSQEIQEFEIESPKENLE